FRRVAWCATGGSGGSGGSGSPPPPALKAANPKNHTRATPLTLSKNAPTRGPPKPTHQIPDHKLSNPPNKIKKHPHKKKQQNTRSNNPQHYIIKKK
ncbi:hypothetical protein, partial [Enterobacter asburiae]